jgi:hypothetical protein
MKSPDFLLAIGWLFATIAIQRQHLLAEKQESKNRRKEKHGYYTDRYFDTCPGRRIAHLVSQ